MVNALFSSEVRKAGTSVMKGTSCELATPLLRAISMNMAMSSSRVCKSMKARIGFSAAARALSNDIPWFM